MHLTAPVCVLETGMKVLMRMCTAAAVICFLYYGIIVLYAGIRADFAWFWPAAGAFCLLVSWRLKAALSAGRPASGPFFAAAWALLCAGLLFLVCGSCLVVSGMRKPEKTDLKYIVVLGAQVRGEKPSRALRLRLEGAVSWAADCPDAVLILSGGQGSGEEITEAECMRRFLIEKGIPESRMILEDRSSTTRENLLFSDRLTGCAKEKTGVLTNAFHVYRACLTARRCGYEAVTGLPAGHDPVMELHYVVRENFALVKEYLFGR